MESVSDQLANLAVIRQLLLQRVAAGESAKLATLLTDIADELERKLAGPPLTEYGTRRLNQAIRELRDVVSIPAPDLSELAEIEATWAASTLTTIAIDAALPTAAVLTSIAESSLVQGATIKTWFQRLEESTQFEIERAVRLGVATGETNQQIARRILGIRSDGERGPEVMKRARRDAESITRTAVQTIANDARLATYEANTDVLDGVQQVSTLDGRTSDICIACSGKVWTLPDYKPKGHKIPWNGGTPRHWRCLPGDAAISACGEITGVSKRWIDADLVVINTASGNEIACTPNHPILTDRGWTAAQFIDESHKIGCGALSEREGITEWDNQNVVPSIHDVTESFLRSRQVLPVPVPLSAEDFHGDGADSEVAVVWSDSFLACHCEPFPFKSSDQRIFVERASAGTVTLKAPSNLSFFVNCFRFAAHRIVGRFRQLLALFKGATIHTGFLLLRTVSKLHSVGEQNLSRRSNSHPEHLCNANDANSALEKGDDLFFGDVPQSHASNDRSLALGDNLNASFGKDSSDDFLSDAQLTSDLLSGKYGLISFDDIVSIGRRKFSGHVYNLETKHGFYVANGIITHNCRSTTVPVTKSFRDLGIDLDELPPGTRASMYGPVAQDLSFDDFLRSQPPDFADEMLGKGRAELWRSGRITLAQLLDARGNPLTLAELRKRTVSSR